MLLIARVWLPNQSDIIIKLLSVSERQEVLPILPQLEIYIFIGKLVTSTGSHIGLVDLEASLSLPLQINLKKRKAFCIK